jgi:hypothetical protein
MKSMILIRGEKQESYNIFKDRVLDFARKVAGKAAGASVSLTLTEATPPSLSVIPFKRKKIAVLSISGKKEGMIELTTLPKGFAGVYRVTEALPVSYTKDWADGQPTPGACLLTLFRKKKRIDDHTFLDRWHNSHTPLSLKIHPLWHYNRNVVDERSASTREPWDGIVEEHVIERRQLTNPFIFFGNPVTMWRNMIRVYTDTSSFLDYRTIETYLVREYWIQS